MKIIPISILIVSYKRNKLLTECIMSVLSNNYIPSEIIVVNNAKDKATKALICGLNNRGCKVRYFENKINNISIARNKALLLARNNFVAFLDDDCIVNENWLQCGYIELKKDTSCLYTGKNLNREKGNISSYDYDKTESYFSKFRRKTNQRTTSLLLDTKNCMFDRRLLKKKNIYFDSRFLRLEDLDLSYTLAKQSVSIIYLEHMVVRHYYRNSLIEVMKNEFQIGYYTAMVWHKYKTGNKTKASSIMPYSKNNPKIYRYISRVFTNLGIYMYKLYSNKSALTLL